MLRQHVSGKYGQAANLIQLSHPTKQIWENHPTQINLSIGVGVETDSSLDIPEIVSTEENKNELD